MTITLYATKNGQVYKGESFQEWSVAKKIYGMLQEKTSQSDITEKDKKLCAMLIAMLNYGAEAQKAFNKNYDPAELVNVNVDQYAEYATAQLPAIQDTSTVTENGLNTVTLYKGGLALESVIQFQPVFIFPDTNFGEYTAQVICGNSETYVSIESANYKTWGVVIYEKLQAKEMNTKISVTIYRNGEAVSETYSFSIMDFAANMVGGQYDALVKAMLTYGAAAENYFN
jgi:hypothetical protein